jgi:hypothetical protein
MKLRVTPFLIEWLCDSADALRAGEFRRILSGFDSPIPGRVVRVRWKRERGRQPWAGIPRTPRFLRNPNRVAATIATDVLENFYEDWEREKPGKPRPHKFPGTKTALHVTVADYAVKLVNARYVRLMQQPREAHQEPVLGLLKFKRADLPEEVTSDDY